MSRDDRFYHGVDGQTGKHGGWRQCKYCQAYADAGKGEIPPVAHLVNCPVGELEAVRSVPSPQTIVMTGNYPIWGRLGVGADVWAELTRREKETDGNRSSVYVSHNAFKTLMNALRHCGEKHYVESVASEAAGPVPSPQGKPFVTGESSEWWVCFPCWKAYYVPTTGYYGKCQDCGRETRRWPADPNETLRLTEWRRPTASPPVAPEAAGPVPSPNPQVYEQTWQRIYEAAAHEGCILHDDTVTAIANALVVRSDDLAQSPEHDVLDLITSALKLRQWNGVFCGACSRKYYECSSCGEGITIGVEEKKTKHHQCSGHRNTPCAATCLVAIALAEVERLRVAPNPQEKLHVPPTQVVERAGHAAHSHGDPVWPSAIGGEPRGATGRQRTDDLAVSERVRHEGTNMPDLPRLGSRQTACAACASQGVTNFGCTIHSSSLRSDDPTQEPTR